jgi:hypothetical protein
MLLQLQTVTTRATVTNSTTATYAWPERTISIFLNLQVSAEQTASKGNLAEDLDLIGTETSRVHRE